jgi:hypothetical protein
MHNERNGRAFCENQLARPRRRYKDEISRKDIEKIDGGGLGLCSVGRVFVQNIRVVLPHG